MNPRASVASALVIAGALLSACEGDPESRARNAMLAQCKGEGGREAACACVVETVGAAMKPEEFEEIAKAGGVSTAQRGAWRKALTDCEKKLGEPRPEE